MEKRADLTLLYFGPRGDDGRWLLEAIQDGSGGKSISLVSCSTFPEAIALLRKQSCDLLIVRSMLDIQILQQNWQSIATILPSGQPWILLEDGGVEHSVESSTEWVERCGGMMVSLESTTPQLLWQLLKTLSEVGHLRREKAVHKQSTYRQRERELREVDRLLSAQRGIFLGLQGIGIQEPMIESLESGGHASEEYDDGSPRENGLDCLLEHGELIRQYSTLLQAYSLGSEGDWGAKLEEIASLLMQWGATSRQYLRLHLFVLEELLQGLGARASQHIVSLADLLALEMIGRLADRYRENARRTWGRPVVKAPRHAA